MAIPAFIGHSHIGVTLIAELSLIPVTIHTGTVQTDGMRLSVTRLIGSYAIPYDGEFPVLQKRFVINPDKGLRFHTLLLVCGNFRFRNITGLPANRIMPNRVSDQSEEDDQPRDNLLPIIHEDLLLKETPIVKLPAPKGGASR